MELQGKGIIAGQVEAGEGETTFHAINPATGHELAPGYRTASPAQVRQACAAAASAAEPYRHIKLSDRAALLDAIADNIEALGEPLIHRAMEETGLPQARLEGERARTTGQLRLFANVVRQGDFLDRKREPSASTRAPSPQPELRSINIPLGPVAVFGASNFPLAFSVAGGDTAAGLAAGCPVVFKAHPAHPGTCELVAGATLKAITQLGLPPSVFSLLFDAGHDVGAALVA
ncbi:MAG: aldehyde dehydrogenase family protein, partial [Sinobacteraceae bacterium]|nr:aldehyde dehydrogenase family protein [Nevskiaceae bacterium]